MIYAKNFFGCVILKDHRQVQNILSLVEKNPEYQTTCDLIA